MEQMAQVTPAWSLPTNEGNFSRLPDKGGLAGCNMAGLWLILPHASSLEA